MYHCWFESAKAESVVESACSILQKSGGMIGRVWIRVPGPFDQVKPRMPYEPKR